MSYTLILLIITVVISILGFKNNSIIDKYILWPARMKGGSEPYRFLTSGFIHADTTHLAFNMLSLYLIGQYVEYLYATRVGQWHFIALYLLGIIVANIPSYIKHQNNYHYRSLGASGGVSAVIFGLVYFGPWSTLSVWFIPMPAIVFAGLYIAYCIYAGKKGGDFVNHDAHLWGGIFGFLFTLLVEPSHGKSFLEKIVQPSFNF